MRLAGHTLDGEGRAHRTYGDPHIGYAWWGGTAGPGRGRCSCGALSPWLGSGAERRRWHRTHKQAIQAEGADQ